MGRVAQMPVEPVAQAEFQIPAEGKYVALVRKGVRALAAGAGFDEVECQDIEVAIGEAVTNAVSHVRGKHGEARVRARCRVASNLLVVEVEDESGATCLPLPKSIPAADVEHGRGWFLIHRLMDQVSVRCAKRGLLIRMAKRHRAADASGSDTLNGLPAVA